MIRALTALLLIAGVSGCGTKPHLQYDYGRATMQAYNTQIDLTRPSVADIQHPLTGNEAAAIRLNQTSAVQEAATGESELEQGN